MIQHHNCPYCYRKLHDYYACTCPESKLKYYVLTKPEPFMTEIKPLYKQDLLSVARELPKIPNMNHEEEILRRYSQGGWDSVDQYVTAILLYQKNPFVTQNKTRRETLILWMDKSFTKVKEWLTGLKNRLKQLV